MAIRGPITDWMFSCDRCGFEDPTSENTGGSAHTKQDAIRLMRAHGWRIGNGEHLCPNCSSKRQDGETL